MELRNALLVGVGGSLWLKAVELYIWFSLLPKQEWSLLLRIIPFQLIGILLISIPLTLIFFGLGKEFWLSFIPPLYFIIKDVINVITAGMSLSVLPHTFIEAVLIGLPIGLSWYYLAYKGWVKI